jgi:ribosomal protein L15
MNVSANMFSKRAIEKIEKAGGSVNFIWLVK